MNDVRQGCSTSPLLFTIYIADLENNMKRSDIGVKIGREYLWRLAYADDLVLLTKNEEKMKEKLKIRYERFNMKDLIVKLC